MIDVRPQRDRRPGLVLGMFEKPTEIGEVVE